MKAHFSCKIKDPLKNWKLLTKLEGEVLDLGFLSLTTSETPTTANRRWGFVWLTLPMELRRNLRADPRKELMEVDFRGSSWGLSRDLEVVVERGRGWMILAEAIFFRSNYFPAGVWKRRIREKSFGLSPSLSGERNWKIWREREKARAGGNDEEKCGKITVRSVGAEIGDCFDFQLLINKEEG